MTIKTNLICIYVYNYGYRREDFDDIEDDDDDDLFMQSCGPSKVKNKRYASV